jgi:Abscisic acid G-protein coupled receptor
VILLLQYLTLAFIGFISASSMRGFLRDMRRAFSAIAGGSNSTTLVLLLTELMGLYAISSLLLIRKQLPLRYRCLTVAVHDLKSIPSLPSSILLVVFGALKPASS